MNGLDALRERGGMAWSEIERGWLAWPAAVVEALASDGFEECKREAVTSSQDGRPAGGVWQGINPCSTSMASVVWVARSSRPGPIVFVAINGKPITRTGRDPDEEEGGQG